jgi:hypothetical protein
MLNKLVQLADKLDAEGKHELAEAVDETIQALAAKHKSKVKKMDEDVKKDLMKFVHNVKKNLKQSSQSLEEFFRRLRYFGIDDTVKEFGLDKSLKEIAKLLDTIDGANIKFYEIAFGKKPSKTDMDDLAKALDGKLEEQNVEDPISFFRTHSKGMGGSGAGMGPGGGKQDGSGPNPFCPKKEEQDAEDPLSFLGAHSNQMDESIFGRDQKGERLPKILEDIECEDCKEQMPLKVMRSGAGYYLGRQCKCGPFSRESKYFKSAEEAQEYLDSLGEPAAIEITQKPEQQESTEEDLKEFWKKDEK